ncbi:MAG: MBG domain-containing protein [Candidatus Methylacidiphilales bacterium]
MLSSVFSPRRWYSVVVAAWCVVWVALPLQLPVYGNPSGGTVAGGSATISTAPGQVTVNQTSQRAVVNWRDFSIAKGETTTFVQPGRSSATLNRVTGGNASQIYGSLNANGRVYLVNPNGVVIGKTGRVNTGGGFTASSLDVTDAQFMNGKSMNFKGDSTAKVVNYGKIKATDGDITLIARQVENHGRITARNGRAQLAAGTEVLIKSEGAERVYIMPNARGAAGETGIINTGRVKAAVAEFKAAGGNEYALAINNTGVIRATGSRTEGGRVYLSSTGGTIVNGAGGRVRAVNKDGSGGEVRVLAGRIDLKKGSVIDVSARQNPRGENAAGGKGGTILVGGDARGHGTLEQARLVTVEAGAELKADGFSARGTVTPEAGGKVVVWSTGITDFNGSISAQGSNGGPGGWVETSGHDLSIGLATTVLTGGGEWLLDPATLEVVATGGTASLVSNTNSPTAASTINASTIVTALNSGNTVTLNATTSIIVSAAITATAGTLNFTTPQLNLNAAISGPSITGTGVTTVNVGAAGKIQNGLSAVAANGTVNVAAGTYNERLTFNKGLTLTGAGSATTIVDATATGGSVVTMQSSTGTVVISGFTFTNGSGANGGGLNVAAGNITINNSIITNNTVTGSGGGIYVTGNTTVTVNNSTISGNTANGTATNNGGGGLYGNTATITFNINDSTISGNTASSGGGVYGNAGTKLNIRRSTVTNNSLFAAGVSGGGIYSANSAGTLYLEDSFVTFNTGRGNGGGMTINGSVVNIINTDITDNTTTSAASSGGGINFAAGTIVIDNSRILRNSAGEKGGGFANASASLTITSSDVSNNFVVNSTSGGGGIYNTGTLNLTGSTVTYNTAPTLGAGMFVSGGASITTIDSSSVSHNNTTSTTVATNGGGIANQGGRLIIQNQSYITYNYLTGTSGSGAGTYNYGGGHVINTYDSYISNNTAITGGAGVYVNGSTGSFNRTTLADNVITLTSTSGGGGIYSFAGNYTIDGSLITRNTAVDRGGGVLNLGIMTITNTTISDNVVTSGNGGGLYQNGASVTITGSTISGNSSLYQGAGIFTTVATVLDSTSVSNNFTTSTSTVTGTQGAGIRASGALTIRNNSSINNNTASGTIGEGGGIYSSGSGAGTAVNITDSIISFNTSALRAGGVLINNSTAAENNNITRTIISDNTVNVVSSSINNGGGGLYLAAGKFTIMDSTIQRNSSPNRGGGIYSSTSDGTFTNSIIANNTSTAGNGGGLFVLSGAISFTNSSFTGNRALNGTTGSGGGIYITTGTVGITSSTVANNSSVSLGGGIATIGGALTIRNSTIGNNTTGTTGGGVYANNGSVTVENSTVSRNSANSTGGGIALTNNTSALTITLLNSIVAGNTGPIVAANGVDILTQPNNVFTDSGNNLIGIREGISGTPLKTNTTTFPDTYTQTGTFGAPLDAKLAPLGNYGGTTLTMALLPGSPALAKGPALAVAGVDQRGIARPAGSKADIGAFESQGFTYTATSGSGQSAQLTTAFASPLVVTVTSNDPGLTNLAGSVVSLSLPGSGATATGTLTQTLNASNQAAFSLTANNILGTYNASVVQDTSAYFTLTNSPINITILPTSGLSKIYGDSDPLLTYGLSAGFLLSGDSLNGALSYTGGQNAGIHALTLGTLISANNPNYVISLDASTVDFTINPRSITINPTASQSKLYGNMDPTLLYTVGGLGLITPDVLSGTLAYAGGQNAGAHVFTLGTLTSANNPNYAITLRVSPGSFTINQRAVVINPVAGQGKLYGNPDPVLLYDVGGDGLATGDALSGALSYSGGPNVGSYLINQGSVTTTNNPNYAITLNAAPVYFAINQRSVVINPLSGQSKLYGNADPVLNYTVGGDGLAGAEALSGLLSYAGGPNAGSYPITLGTVTTANNPNYSVTLNSTSVNFSINQRSLIITPVSGQDKLYGNIDPALTFGVSGDGLHTGDSLVGALSRIAGENVGDYAIIQGSLSASPNYAISFTPGIMFEISQRPVTIIPTGGQSKVYGYADPALTYTVGGSGMANSETLSGALTYAGGPNVGNYPITLGSVTSAMNPNYAVSLSSTPVFFAINPRSLVINPTPGLSKLYDDADPAFGYTVTGDGLYGTDTMTGNPGRVAGENVSTYSYTLGTIAAGVNYSLSLAGGTYFTINPRSIVVTPDSGQNKMYGAADPAIYTFSTSGDGFRNGDTFSGSLGRDSGEAAGYYQIRQGSLSVGSNYTLTFSSTPVLFTINGAPITVTPHFGQGKVYGDSDPGITYSITSGSLVPGDTLTGQLTYTGGPNVGSYVITQGNLMAPPSYLLTFDSSVLFNINPRALTITPGSGQGKIYGYGDPSLTYVVGGAGLVNGDRLTGQLSRLNGENAGAYAITQGTLAASANYAINFIPSVLFNIAPRNIAVMPNSGQEKYIGEEDPALTYTLSTGELVAGDSLLGSLGRAPGETAGDYLILPGTLSASSNYLLTFSGIPVNFQILSGEGGDSTNGGGNSTGFDASSQDLSAFNATRGRNNESERYYTKQTRDANRSRTPSYSGNTQGQPGISHMSSFDVFGKDGQIKAEGR